MKMRKQFTSGFKFKVALEALQNQKPLTELVPCRRNTLCQCFTNQQVEK